MNYKEVRGEITAIVERKRNAFSNDLKAMDVDQVTYEDDSDMMWWGGKGPSGHEPWEYQNATR